MCVRLPDWGSTRPAAEGGARGAREQGREEEGRGQREFQARGPMAEGRDQDG